MNGEDVKHVVFEQVGPLIVANPPELVVRKGERVRFPARARSVLFFPEAELLGPPSEGRHADGLIPLDMGFEFTVPELARPTLPKAFFYAVFDRNLRRFAIGGSDPKIIVEP